MKQSIRVLGVFPLAMLTVAAIVSLRNLPLSAEFGLTSVFYYVIAALIFFIPIALVTAELATGWPKAGASYIWVSEAFGKPVGFFALWLAWMESIAWFPAILAFAATMFSYVLAPFFPNLENNTTFILIVMLNIFWGATFLNFLGIKTSSWISSAGVLLGTLIPGMLIIGLGVWWMLTGKATELIFSWDALIPDFTLDKTVFFSGVLLGLAGVELAAFHLREAKNPQKDYPKALLIAVILILFVSVLGTLSIASVVPSSELSLLSGLVQAFHVFLTSFHLDKLLPLVASFLLIGALAGINTWTVGPAKGLLITAQDGFLPPFLQKTNAKGVPVGMLLFQALIGSILSLVFLYLEDNSAAFWILTGLAAQFTMVQYIIIFLAGLRLRYTQPETTRAFKVPGGWFGIWVVVLLGILSCVFGFGITFLPPEQIEVENSNIYMCLLLVSLVLLSLLPITLCYFKKTTWKKRC